MLDDDADATSIVTFVGDHFALTTRVTETQGMSDEAIIEKVQTNLLEFYGWNVEAVSNEINVESDSSV
jgi:hypothetical protein